MHRFCQWRKILTDGLVDQDIPIGQIKYLFLDAASKQPPDNLKCRIGLAGSRCHHEQNPLLPACNRIQCTIDRDPLIIARRIGVLAGIIRLRKDFRLQLRKPGSAVDFPLIAGNQFFLCRELSQREFTFPTRKRIIFGKAIAVRAERKRHIQHPGIVLRLLHTMRYRMLVILGLYDSNRIIRPQVQHIICFQWLFPIGNIAANVHFTIGNLRFHGNLPLLPLASNRRGNILKFNVLFCHLIFG